MRLIKSMSQEKAKEFYEFSKNDNELQDNLKAAQDSAIVVQLGAEKGYEFTESEWQFVMQEAIAEDELCEEDLLAIAAGYLHVDAKDVHIHTD